LLFGSEHDDRIEPKHVHVDGRGTGHAGTGLGNRPHHDRGFEDAETRAAILLGDADTEPTSVGERLVEVGGEAALPVLLQPIGVVEAGADFHNGITDRFLVGGEREIHLLYPFAAGAGLVTPSRTSAVISSVEKPAWRRTSSPCSLRRGASRVGSAGVSDQVAETFMLRIAPSVG